MLNKLVKIKLNAAHKSILSDLFVDLAAGWLGAIFVNFQLDVASLTLNIILAIFCLRMACFFKHKKLKKQKYEHQ